MSSNETSETRTHPELEHILVAPAKDLGGFAVRRALPSAQRRMVGPFIFLDHIGPAMFQPSHGIDVRPHPHIGLATVTYLFDGEILHRDSLGMVQSIQPGAVNWMTAGRGIAHSERTAPERRATGGRVFGMQAWVALPKQHEETEPSFVHHPASTLPLIEGEGARVNLIAGSLYGKRSPVKTLSDMFYAAVTLEAGARLALPPDYTEQALYIAEGSVELDGMAFGTGELLICRPGSEVVFRASAPARLLLLGGEPMEGPRHVFWNFVSSSRERIEVAKADWKAGRFAPVPQETEFIPLPEDPPPVNYP